MYKRVLLKISGEALMGSLSYGVDPQAAKLVAQNIAELAQKGRHEVAVVVGGGNIFRGIQSGPKLGMERTPADQIGMLATLINGIALREALKEEGCDVVLLSAFECPLIAERYQWEKALKSLHKGKILIFAGGTGHPYFTTDSAAALRACEIKADILLKATTRVDGIYDRDPLLHKGAVKFDHLTYLEVVEKKLGVMDLTAVTLCMTGKIPIRVFNFYKESLLNASSGSQVGTLIS
jgi:uridylate kinase